jgi:hypothetical protein
METLCRKPIVMRNSLRLVGWLVFLLSYPCFGGQPPGKQPLTPEQRIARLGMALCGTKHGRPVFGCPVDDEPGFDMEMEDIRELARTPALSARLLIADLHTIPDSQEAAREDGPRTEHTMAEIRALRYLTGGMDFRASSKHRFGKSDEEVNRKYWLTFDHPDSLSFFALWPSHGRWYVAPRGAQLNIIAQWKSWYASNGPTFDYHPLKDAPPEKWIW